MIITSRTQSVLQLLVDGDTHISVQDLAEKLNLAERTIYKEIAEIRKILKNCNIALEVVPGKGFQLNGSEEGFASLRKLIEKNEVNYEWNIKKRMDMSMLILLSQNDYIKTDAIAILLNVSVPTVRNDLKQVESELEKVQLKLIRKKGEGLYVEGDNIRKGHFATSIFMNYINSDVFYGIFQKNKKYKNNFITNILEEYGYDKILYKLKVSLGDYIISNFNTLSDVKFEEFILLLMMLLKYHESPGRYQKLEGETSATEKDMEMAAVIRDCLEAEFSLSFAEDEFRYIVWLTSINNKSERLDKFKNESKWNTVNKVKELVNLFANRMQLQLEIEEDFFNMLLEHINGAFERKQNGVFVTNPLKKDIETQYGKVIGILDECMNEVFPDLQFSGDEVSYLALYFAVAVDKSTAKTIDVLVVCTSGMGSSKMLASRLEREIPEINIRKTISLLQLNQEDLDSYDFILSTVPLDMKKENYMVITPLLNKNEVERIKSIIAQKDKKQMPGSGRFYSTIFNSAAGAGEDTEFELEKMNKVVDLGVELVKKFRIVPISGIRNDKDSLKECLIDFGILPEDLEAPYVFSDVTLIPETRLGYLEIEYTAPVNPTFIMLLHDDDKYSFDMKAIIALIYNNKIEEYMLDMLSSIIEAIIDNIKVILTQTNNEVMMKHVLEDGVKKYISNNFFKGVSNNE